MTRLNDKHNIIKSSQLNSKYHVPNLERALDIFDLLSQNPQGLSSSEISGQLNFPRNSVFRIVSTLSNYGYLERDEELKLYKLSLKMLTIGMRALTDPPLVEKSLEVMHSLQNKYKETVPLGILRDGQGVIIEEVVGTHLFRYVLEPGKLFQLHTAAPGKAILAYLPDDEREKLIEKISFKVYTKRTIKNPAKLRSVLDEVRRQGYAVDHAEEIEGMHCLAAPIFNRHGYPVASIWITGPSMRIHEKDFTSIGKDVRKHADKISKSLGYYPSKT
ncbi:IclR family transcriptional regulator [Bacteroidota bacterium]